MPSEMAKVTGYKINAVAEFFCVFTLIVQAVEALFDALDYQNHSELFHRRADDTAASIIWTILQNCFIGMAMLIGIKDRTIC